MDPGDYVRAFGRNWWIIVVCALLGLGVATLVVGQTEPTYTSSSRLVVSPNVTQQTTNSDAYTGTLLARERIQSYAGLASGSTVAERVIDELDLDVTPDELMEGIEAVPLGESTVLEVTVTGTDPDQVPLVNQAVLEATRTVITGLERPPQGGRLLLRTVIADPPTETATAIPRQEGRKQAIGAITGLLVGLGIAAARGRFHPRVRREEDVVAAARAPVLVRLPRPKRREAALLTHIADGSETLQAYRILRARLSTAGDDARSFLVAGPTAKDDATAVAVNLALSFAATGAQTVVIDVALREPRLTDFLSLPRDRTGLAEWLTGDAEWDQCITWLSPGVDVLGAGSPPENPSGLIDSAATRELLDQLSSSYNVVVLLAAAITGSVDAAVLAAQCDGAVVVVRHGMTGAAEIETSAERLRGLGGNLLGTVVHAGARVRHASRRTGEGGAHST